ncbi:hypothetical protein [Modestobacter lapidis]|nr:hypothetical protein [Modestobacter lapidis]
MTTTPTPRTAHRTNTAKVVGSLGVVAAAAAVAGLGVFGSFTDSTTPAVVSVDNGVVSVDLAAAGGGASVPLEFGSVLPGSSLTQPVDLVNDGTSALSSVSLATTATKSSLLDTDATNGLQMSVESCSVAWTASATCDGDVRTVLASGPVVRTAALVAPRSLAADATDHLAVTVTLPSSAGDAFRAQASNLQMVFTAVQRDGAAR